MPDNYDTGEAYAAGDDESATFDNAELIALFERLEDLLEDRGLLLRVFAEVVAAIYNAGRLL